MLMHIGCFHELCKHDSNVLFLILQSCLPPLAMILTQNKLTGEDYMDWKRNLDIVLTAENHKMVLTTPCPMHLIEESDPADKEAYAS